MYNHLLIKRVQTLRSLGKTYGEIRSVLKQEIPKSTLSHWCRLISLPLNYSLKIKKIIKDGANKGRTVALIVNQEKRKQYLKNINCRNSHLPKLLNDKKVAKLVLAILYFTEGAKKQQGSLMLGNSDPVIINLFLRLLRQCYKIDERKFRCTVQCRADQKTKELEQFWSKTTNISLDQFYKTRIDPRTIDKPSKNPDYKGVCRIDYFSGDIYNELKAICCLINPYLQSN